MYYAKDVLGDPNIYSFLGLVQLLPLIIGLWFMPAIIARFGKRKLILVGVVITVLGCVISLIDPAASPSSSRAVWSDQSEASLPRQDCSRSWRTSWTTGSGRAAFAWTA